MGGIVSLLFYLWMSIGNIVVNPPNVEKILTPAPQDLCFRNQTQAYNASSVYLNITNPAPAAL